MSGRRTQRSLNQLYGNTAETGVNPVSAVSTGHSSNNVRLQIVDFRFTQIPEQTAHQGQPFPDD